MTKSLKIPKEQRSFAARGAQSVADAADRRDRMTGVQSSRPGDADVNLDEMGRYGNLKQNMTAHRNVMER
ncbi:hypothetical protein BH09PSE1_BH09PSE1_08720 [soil metagenome]